MSETAIKECIVRLAEPLAHALGLVVWGVEIARGYRTIIRLFIDVPLSCRDTCLSPAPSEASVAVSSATVSASVGMCEKISRALELALEVEDCLSNSYVLEVSTPGLSRVFFTREQMRPYLGDIVEARLHTALPAETGNAGKNAAGNSSAPRKLWLGKLIDVTDTAFVIAPVVLSPAGEGISENMSPVCLPWQAVRRVNRVHIFPVPAKPGKSPKKRTTLETAICTPPVAAVGGTHES